MFFYYQSESPASWVMAQTDWRKDHTIFGVAMESQGLIECGFENGVRAFLATGEHSHEDAAHRLIGTEGMMEVLGRAVSPSDERPKQRRQTIDQPEDLHDWDAVSRGIAELVDALGTDREPRLSAHLALRSTDAGSTCR